MKEDQPSSLITLEQIASWQIEKLRSDISIFNMDKSE